MRESTLESNVLHSSQMPTLGVTEMFPKKYFGRRC